MLRGDVTVITGPMRSGKSEDLIRRIKRHRIANRNIIVFKPDKDSRFCEGKASGRDGGRADCVIVPSEDPSYMLSFIKRDKKGKSENVDVVAIDEAQFFKSSTLKDVVSEMADSGIKVIISGLDTTSDREPFGEMGSLMAIADNVIKLKAVCEVCRDEDSLFTFADFKKKEVIEVGDEGYLSLCRDCYNKKMKR